MEIKLSGATRLFAIIGDPIAQVRSPAGVTQSMIDRGHDALVAPVQVAVEDVAAFVNLAKNIKNLDGILVTVPHKFACLPLCANVTPRAAFIGAVNVMARTPKGWAGDMVDGIGFLAAAKAQGFKPQGARALLAGAGGAGSAIAFALMEAGVAELAIYDANAPRRDALIARLGAQGPGRVSIGSDDPTGFDFIANATPAGMPGFAPSSFDLARLTPAMFVACVVTVPEITPLIAAARQLGCATSTGTAMYAALQELLVDFLLQGQGARA